MLLYLPIASGKFVGFFTINLSSIKNIYHRKSDLFKIYFKNSEGISGYFEAFLK
jgi:hypothetical protein